MDIQYFAGIDYSYEAQKSKLEKLLSLPKLPRRGKSHQDSSILLQRKPPVWDSPSLIRLAKYNDKVLLHYSQQLNS